MKRIMIIVFLLTLLILLCMLPWVSRTYTFSNSVENIVSIELLINSNEVGKAEEDKLVFQKSLSVDEINCFMAEIYKLETRRQMNGAMTDSLGTRAERRGILSTRRVR